MPKSQHELQPRRIIAGWEAAACRMRRSGTTMAAAGVWGMRRERMGGATCLGTRASASCVAAAARIVRVLQCSFWFAYSVPVPNPFHPLRVL